MALLVAATEALLAWQSPGFMNGSGWEFRWSAEAARHSARSCDVLFFGDSIVKMGVLPRALEASAGLRAVNLAVGGAQAPAHYTLLRRAIDAGARPQAVVIGCLPLVLKSEPERTAEVLPYVLNLGECLELAWTARDASFGGQLVLARLLPSVRYRLPLRAFIKSAHWSELAKSRYTMNTLTREFDVNRGGLPFPARLPNEQQPSLPVWGSTFFSEWGCHPANLAYIRKFLRLAHAAHIKVYWLVLPVTSDLHQWCQQNGFDADYSRFLRGLQREFPDLTVVDGRDARYDDAVFRDRHHLGREGAIALSSDLGRLIAGSGNSSRQAAGWITLPAYQPRKATFPIEDFTQARTALREHWARARGLRPRK